jgi:hypothetical protein
LRSGNNVILFTAAPGNATNYNVKNIRIVYKPAINKTTYTLLKTDTKIYIKGVTFPAEIKKLTVGGVSIDLNQPEFEVILDKNKLGLKKINKMGINFLRKRVFNG